MRPELYHKEEEEQHSESRRASAGLRLPPLGDPESVIYMAPDQRAEGREGRVAEGYWDPLVKWAMVAKVPV